MVMEKNVRIEMLKQRKNLLLARDPVANANIVRKIERELRKLEG
jgi:hypothetical protein